METNTQSTETCNYMFSLEDIKQLIEKSTSEEDTLAYVKLLSKLEMDLKDISEHKKVDDIKNIIEREFEKQSTDEQIQLLTNPTYNEIIRRVS